MGNGNFKSRLQYQKYKTLCNKLCIFWHTLIIGVPKRNWGRGNGMKKYFRRIVWKLSPDLT